MLDQAKRIPLTFFPSYFHSLLHQQGQQKTTCADLRRTSAQKQLYILVYSIRVRTYMVASSDSREKVIWTLETLRNTGERCRKQSSPHATASETERERERERERSEISLIYKDLPYIVYIRTHFYQISRIWDLYWNSYYYYPIHPDTTIVFPSFCLLLL